MGIGHSTGIHRSLVGLDAGCFGVLDPLFDGELPDVALAMLATFGVAADERTLPIVEPAGEERNPDHEAATGGGTTDWAVEARLENVGSLERP